MARLSGRFREARNSSLLTLLLLSLPVWLLLLQPTRSRFEATAAGPPVDESDSPRERKDNKTSPGSRGKAPSDRAPRELKKAGVCSRCHVVSVLEWGVSPHVKAGTTCQECHGPSKGHVANERNEVKPDRIPQGAAIAKLCVHCHDDGCPETLELGACQKCHHTHALVDPANPGAAQKDRLKELYARWQRFRHILAEGERLVALEKWKAASEAYGAALELIPGHRGARMRIQFCERRLDPALPGFKIVGEAFDRRTGLPREVQVPALGLSMVLVPPGEFDIGADQLAGARPVHTVPVEAFYLGKFEVTQGQWKRWLGSNPSTHKGKEFPDGDRMPVESISWEDCQVLIKILNERVLGGGFRLPTEAEWEYACRAGSVKPIEKSNLGKFAWFVENSARRPDHKSPFPRVDAFSPRPVGTRQPNPWGLHDMQGNVWEWCSSLWRPYLFDPADGRESSTARGLRLLRGGSFADAADILHPALRHPERAHRRYRWNGLRLARTVPARS